MLGMRNLIPGFSLALTLLAGATSPLRDAVDEGLVEGVRRKSNRIIDTPRQSQAAKGR